MERILVFVLTMFFMVGCTANDFDIPLDKAETDYKVFHAENSKGVPIFADRNFGELFIYSKATSFEGRAQTCLLAAKNYLEQEDLKYVRVFHLPYGHEILVGKGSYIAKCEYAPDGKGKDGISALRMKTWQASAFKGKVDKLDALIEVMWWQKQGQFQKNTKYGHVTDEVALKRAISNETDGKLSPEEIHLPMYASQLTPYLGRDNQSAPAAEGISAISKPSIPTDITFSVLRDEKKRDIKRSVDVLLNKRVSEDTLKAIASNIKLRDSNAYQRTFIGYFYKGQASSTYWATTNFDPDLKIIIFGLPYEAKTLSAKKPTQYPTVEAMINGFNDFSLKNGTFKIISKNPLHIQLSPREMKGTLPKVIEDDTNRAIMYGVYRTFIHTPVNKITITGIAQEIIDINTHQTQYIPKYKRTITITKSKALELVKGYLDITSLSDLVSDDKWTKDFMRLYYNDRGYPGLDRFVGIKH